jgi:hypothetical protein
LSNRIRAISPEVQRRRVEKVRDINQKWSRKGNLRQRTSPEGANYSDRLLALLFRPQGPQPFGDGAPGFRQLHPVLVEASHHRQDEIGLGLMELPHK